MNTLKIEIPILDEIKLKLEKIESTLDSIKNQGSFQNQVWLTTKQAAVALDVSPRTLQTYRDQGIIGFSQFGRTIRYRAEDIQAFLLDHFLNPKQIRGGLTND